MAFIRLSLAGPSRAGRLALVLFSGAFGVWGVPAARAQCPLSFAAAVAYSTGGTGPQSVTIGDLNGDGRPDLAVANSNSGNVSVLLNNGNGSFAAAVNYAVGSNPSSVAIGDLNGDGRPDLAVSNRSSNSVSVLLGNGPPNTGTFGSAVNYAVGGAPNSVAIGDLNGDGRPDLAVSKQVISNNVAVLLNNAPPNTGTFGAAVNYSAGTTPWTVAIGDLTGDGRPDLATANTNVTSSSVSLFLSNGGGTFTGAVNYGVGVEPRSAAIGDLNGDGRPDLAAANSASSNVSVLLGNGNGTFGAPFNYAAGGNPWSVAIGDLNGDGRTDLAVANLSSNNVSVLLNNGASIGISQQPVGQTVTAGQNAVFSVTATGATSYLWRRNGVVLSNGGRFGGVTTGTLTISGTLLADVGVYDVQIGSACNAGVTSSPAVLTVRGCNPADIATVGSPDPFSGADGFLTGEDFDAFIILFFQGC